MKIEGIEVTDCFAIPGNYSIIDAIHPATGKGLYSAETLEQVQARYPGAVQMTLDDFCEAKAKEQNTPVQWDEETEEDYYEMLEVLPPAAYNRAVGGFMVGEPDDHCAATGAERYRAHIVRKVDGVKKYLRASRPMTIKEFKSLV